MGLLLTFPRSSTVSILSALRSPASLAGDHRYVSNHLHNLQLRTSPGLRSIYFKHPSFTSTNLLGASYASYGLSSYSIAGGACCPDSACRGIGIQCVTSSTNSGYDCEELNQSSSVRNLNLRFRSSLRVPHCVWRISSAAGL